VILKANSYKLLLHAESPLSSPKPEADFKNYNLYRRLHKSLSRILSEIESDAEFFEAALHTNCNYVILYPVFYMQVCRFQRAGMINSEMEKIY